MSRLAVQSSGTHAYGLSRIPRPLGHSELVSRDLRLGTMQNGHEKPSRLQRLQIDFQKHLMKEKEDKLIEIYEQNQQRALDKVGRNKGGVVRDFFNERRTNGSAQSSPKNNQSPTMEHMYKKKQLEAKQTIQPRKTFGYNGHHYTSQGQQPKSQPASYKSSAGRDRSNPLAPIQKAGQPGNPFPSKPQIVRPRTISRDKENLVNKEPMPRSAPTGFYGMDNDSASDDSPLPNAKQLAALQQKRKLLQSQRSNKSFHSVQSNGGKQTDFQKWQAEQEKERDNRLKRHREKNGVIQHPPEDEGFGEEDDDGVSKEDMKRKQAELIAQIEAQQRELERIKQDRQQEEMEEKKEMERRKRLEEDRKRKQIEEEKRRRKFEEEERLRREHEEEKERKLQQEKQRLRRTSERSKYEYEDSDMEQDYGHRRREPSPPPQPKPANTVNRRHPVPAKTKLTPRRQPPAPSGEHVALYAAADRLEGAIGDTGRLKACNNCGRKFAEDRIQKHENACKIATKKRKVMDPTKTRTKGTEMEQFVNHRQPEPKPKKNNWRAKHENFMQAIKYARKMKEIEDGGGNIADLPPPPPSENPDYVQCPYCSRKFNEKAAERHIPHCKNTKARPAPVKRR